MINSEVKLTLEYNDGRIAILSSSQLAKSDRQGIISGTEGFIIVENVNNPQSYSIYDFDYKLVKTVKCPPQITGYEYEVIASMEAIENHQTECPDCTHAQSIKLLEIMDEARAQMGIKYPSE